MASVHRLQLSERRSYLSGMRPWLLLFALSELVSAAAQTSPAAPAHIDGEPISPGTVAVPMAADTNQVFTVLEKNAEFPGGQAAMMEYLRKNIHYPEEEKEAEIEGKVFLQFVVRRDGSVSDVRVLRGVPGGTGLDREAIRAVKSMPRWSPGEMNGAQVNAQVSLPIMFKL